MSIFSNCFKKRNKICPSTNPYPSLELPHCSSKIKTPSPQMVWRHDDEEDYSDSYYDNESLTIKKGTYDFSILGDYEFEIR